MLGETGSGPASLAAPENRQQRGRGVLKQHGASGKYINHPDGALSPSKNELRTSVVA